MLRRAPKAIIIDEDSSIQAAVAEEFPDSHYCLCLRQITRKLPQILGRLTYYKAAKGSLENIVYDSIKGDEFEENWEKLLKDFELEKNDWLKSLYQDWHTFWAGKSKTTLKQFVEH